MQILASFLLLFLTALQLQGESEYRTFTNPQGTTMEAKLTRVSGDEAYIERSDGLATKVDISIFSKEDQKYIREWGRKEALKDDGIEVRFTNEVTNKSKFIDNQGGILRKTWEQHYGVVLKNNTYKDVKNVRVDYLILKFEDALAAQKRSEGEVRQLTGSTKVPLIKAREEANADTKKFPMLETKLAPGFVWKGGGKKTSEDEMRGIWVRVYVGDTLVTEISRPESLQRKEVWPTSSAF